METKACKKCNVEKPRTSEYFSKHPNNKDNLLGTCKECRNEYLRERNKKISEKRKEERKKHYESENKVCTKCGEEKPRTAEYFYKKRENRDGLQSHCKICNSERSKQYYEKNKDRVLDKVHQYRKDNIETIKEYKKKHYIENIDNVKKYRRENAEHIRKVRKTYNTKNRENNIEYCRKYKKKHADRLKEYAKDYEKNRRVKDEEYLKIYFRKWMEKNKDKLQVYAQDRRAREAKVLSTLTVEEWQHTINEFENKCCYCGAEVYLTQDHFIPLTKGGNYTKGNILPSCRSCNCSKKDKDFNKWYEERDYYSEERKQKILSFIEKYKHK